MDDVPIDVVVSADGSEVEIESISKCKNTQPVPQPPPSYNNLIVSPESALLPLAAHRKSFSPILQDKLRLYNPVSTPVLYHWPWEKREAASSQYILIKRLSSIHRKEPTQTQFLEIHYESPCRYCKIAKLPPTLVTPCFDVCSELRNQAVLEGTIALVKEKTREIFAREHWTTTNMAADGEWEFTAVYSKARMPVFAKYERDCCDAFCDWCCGLSPSGEPTDDTVYLEDLDLSSYVVYGDLESQM